MLISVGRPHGRLDEANGTADARSNGSGHGRLEVVGEFVRATDHVWVEGGRVYLLLPASDRAAGAGFLARVSGQAPSLVASADVRLVAFPDDGLTSGALLAALAQPAERTLIPSPVQGSSLQAPGPDPSTVVTKGSGSAKGPSLEEQLVQHVRRGLLRVSDGGRHQQLEQLD